MRTHGFTLIEVLVALVVAAMAAAVVLSFTRTQYLRAAQERTYATAVTQLVNDAVRLRITDWREWVFELPQPPERAGRLTAPPWAAGDSVVINANLGVDNFVLFSQDHVPPLAIAYTPIQRFSLSETARGNTVAFLAAALPPPQGAAALNSLPEELRRRATPADTTTEPPVKTAPEKAPQSTATR